MRKRLLLYFSIPLLSFATLVHAAPMVMEMNMGIAEQIEQERSISMTVVGNSVQVTGANGMTLEVVSLTGRHVASYKIDSPAQHIDLNLSKGCYILKVGKFVRKVTIR